MRVCLDTAVPVAQAAGIAGYTEGLVAALDGLPGLDLTTVGPTGGIKAGSRFVWRERHLRDMLAEQCADVLLVTSPEVSVRRVGVPTVAVIHDLFPFTAPDLTPRGRRLRFRFMLPLVSRRAARLVCVSEATRAALLETVDVDPGKVSVIGQGPSAFPVLPRNPDTENPYLLYVGELFPRKNLGTLLDALHGRRLVIAGPGELHDPRAEHLGYVSPQRLAELYAGASALVLPSVEEGFGRPLLDAFARDVPAIASDIPALREVSGGAAHLVPNPLDPDAWRAAIASVLEGEPAALVERGRRRAEVYEWSAIARQWNELLRSLTASSRHSCGT